MESYKNVLVTGGLGFIGSNFINYLYNTNNNCRIINIDKCNYCSNILNINNDVRLSDRYVEFLISLSEEEQVLRILNDYNVDIIIHFAAQSHVTLSFSNTSDFIQDNIVSSFFLFQAVKRYNKLKIFLNVSTDEVYGETSLLSDEQMKETDILNPTNPYSASKACIEMIANAYVYSYNMPLITIRSNNVYGINQYNEKVLPKFINLLNNNKNLTIEGDGNHKRTFIHVDDVCNAIFTVIEKGKIKEVYNIGNNDDEYTIMDIAKMLIHKMKNTEEYNEYVEFINDREYDDKRYYINYDKIKSLGWNHSTKFTEELDNLIEHYTKK